MCDMSEFNFVCGHVLYKLLSECHFTRADPNKEHHGPKVVKESWSQPVPCPECQIKINKAMEEQQKIIMAEAKHDPAHKIPFGPDGGPRHDGHPGQADHQG